MITSAPTAPNPDDLIGRAQSGSETAWRQLLEPYQDDIYRLAYLVLRDAAEAADVQQETFIRAWRKFDQFDPNRPLRPWLMKIALNLARNRYRSLRRAWQRLNRLMQDEAPFDEGPAARSAAQERASLLWQAAQKLPPTGRTIIYLRYFLECSEQEAASVLNLPRGTVKSRTSRAIAQLRGIIQRDYPQLEEDFVGKR